MSKIVTHSVKKTALNRDMANDTIFQADAPSPPTAASYDVIQSVRDYPPGAWTTEGADPGPTAAVVVDGEVMVNVNGQATVFKAGQQWVEPTGVVSKSGNASAARARVLVTKLVPVSTARRDPGFSPLLGLIQALVGQAS